MSAPDDLARDRYPLGAPVRPEPEPAVDEWRALDPSKPWIETNTRTGMMRNTRPTPAAETLYPYPWFGIKGS